MANELLDDHERSEIVKKWIRDNGASIVFGVVLGAAGIGGWNYWKDYREQMRSGAAQGYEQLVEQMQADGFQATTAAFNAFKAEHDNPAYQALAALQLGQQAVEDHNLEEAAQLYRIAAETGEPAAIRHVAGLRLARIQLQNGLLDEALVTVDRHDESGFEALAAQIRGDILAAQGDRESALDAYQYALDNGGTDRQLLQMKIDNLALAPVAEVVVESGENQAGDVATADGESADGSPVADEAPVAEEPPVVDETESASPGEDGTS